MSPARGSGRNSRSEIKRAKDAAQQIERALSTPADLDHSLRTLAVLANSLQQSMNQFSIDWLNKPIDQLQGLCNMGTNLAFAANDARDQIILALGTVLNYHLERQVSNEMADPALKALSDSLTVALNQIAEDAAVAHDRARQATQRNDEQDPPIAKASAVPMPAGDARFARPSVLQTLSEIALDDLEEDITEIETPAEAVDASLENSSTPGVTEHAGKNSADDGAIEAPGSKREPYSDDEPVVANRRTGIYHPAGSSIISRIDGLDRIAFVSAEAAEISGFRRSQAGIVK